MKFYDVEDLMEILAKFDAEDMHWGPLEDDEEVELVVVDTVTNFMPCSLFVVILIVVFVILGIKATKKKEKVYEEQVERIEELEKELEASLEKHKQLEAEILALKTEKEKLSNGKSQLQVKDTENQKRIRALMIENSQLKEQKSKYQREIASKTRSIDELAKNLNRIKTEGKLTENPKKAETSSPPTPPSPELSEKMKEVLFDLQSTRNQLLQENPAEQVAEKARKLIALTDNPEVKKGANLEMKKFNLGFENYMKAVEANIEIIQKNANITIENLPKLPDFPVISKGFLKAYDNIVNNSQTDAFAQKKSGAQKAQKAQETSTDEIDDNECVICLTDMPSLETTLKCDNCRRRYHRNCASEWFKTNSICPVCMELMKDPEEYPPLS